MIDQRNGHAVARSQWEHTWVGPTMIHPSWTLLQLECLSHPYHWLVQWRHLRIGEHCYNQYGNSMSHAGMEINLDRFRSNTNFHRRSWLTYGLSLPRAVAGEIFTFWDTALSHCERTRHTYAISWLIYCCTLSKKRWYHNGCIIVSLRWENHVTWQYLQRVGIRHDVWLLW